MHLFFQTLHICGHFFAIFYSLISMSCAIGRVPGVVDEDLRRTLQTLGTRPRREEQFRMEGPASEF